MNVRCTARVWLPLAWLLLVACSSAWSWPHRELHHHEPFVAAENANAILHALLDPEVSGIMLPVDVDFAMTPDGAGQNIILTRNVTFFGVGIPYPTLSFKWHRSSSMGLQLGPGVVLTFCQILFKQSLGIIPDIVKGDPTSLVVIYDCIFHMYTSLNSPAQLAAMVMKEPRPPWAPAMLTSNQAAVLPHGFCRPNPDLPICWRTALYVISMAGLPAQWSSKTNVRVLVYGLAMVIERIPNRACAHAAQRGNTTCLWELTHDMQIAEKTGKHTRASEAQMKAAGEDLSKLPRLPDPFSILPFWAVTNHDPDEDSDTTTTDGNALKGIDANDNHNDKHIHVTGPFIIGISVGLATLAVLAMLGLWCLWARYKSMTPHSDASNPPGSDTGSKAYVTVEAGDAKATSMPATQGPAHPCMCCEHGCQCQKSDTAQLQILLETHATGTSPISNGSRTHSPSCAHNAEVTQPVCCCAGQRTCTCRAQSMGSVEPGLLTGMGRPVTATPSAVLAKAAAVGLAGGPMSKVPSECFVGHAPPELMGQSHVLSLSQVVTQTLPLGQGINMQVNLETDVLLGEVLGSGSMGTVYRGIYRGDEVAVKVFPPGADLKSFAQEIHILGRTHHPNVVQLLGVSFTKGGRVALLEEMCHGSCEQLLYRASQFDPGEDVPSIGTEHAPPLPVLPVCSLPSLSSPLPLNIVLSIALQTAVGLAYLHPTVIHRDLKPGNILLINVGYQLISSAMGSGTGSNSAEPQSVSSVDESNPIFQVKLSDFGLSRMRDAMTIHTQKPYCGTVPYMAPECFSKKLPQGLTHKCDIFSFGVCLWEMLHGIRPWLGHNPAEIMYQVAVRNKRLSFLVEETRCPRQLRKLIMRCWDSDPDRRPSALEVARELAFIQRQLGFAA